MKKMLTASTAFVLLTIAAFTAQADPFVVELDSHLAPGNDVNLRKSLGLVELERFRTGHLTFLVFEAKSEAYVETYFRAKGVYNPKIMAIRFTHESEGPPEAQGNTVVVAWALSPFLSPTN